MLKNYSTNINIDIYLNAADKLGIKISRNIDDANYFTLTKNNKKLNMFYSIFSFNDSVAFSVVKNKYTTTTLLSKHSLPVPKQSRFVSQNFFSVAKERDAIKTYARNNYPVVLKPVNESLGAGVYVNLNSDQDFDAALSKFLETKPRRRLLIEEYVEGNDYRITVVNGEIIDVIERIKPFIIGDGKTTIQELINQKNTLRLEKRMPKIIITESLQLFLKAQNLDLDSVPNAQEKLTLHGGCNISLGGETKRIPLDKVHSDNKQAFLQAAAVSELYLCGVDFISSDISKSYKEEHSVINELNSNPHIDVNYFADMKMDLTVAQKILTSYFE